MAEAAAAAKAAVATLLLPGLPDEITILEILVRLPPKSLLRCRAVCPAWRRATSTPYFLLAHHRHQPALPLLYAYNFVDGFRLDSLDIIPFDHNSAADHHLHPAARLRHAFFRPLASCDGLVLLSVNHTRFSICNPATRHYAPLPLISGFIFLGMYPHSHTGEYRLLLAPEAQDGCYIYTLGSDQPPRHIRVDCPDFVEEEELISPSGSVLFRGSLHLYMGNLIIVFDTTAESFRQMRAPVDPWGADLFEMDGMLAMSIYNDATTSIDIWMTQDYEREVWALKYRVGLPVAEYGNFSKHWWVVVVYSDGDVLVLIKSGDRLLQVDLDGKLVASFHREGLVTTRFRLKQTLVSHKFFPTLEGYAVNPSQVFHPSL